MPLSFLFVVNELLIEPEQRPEADFWGNNTPPTDRSAYAGEVASSVMRYRNGRVSRAQGYRWYRQDQQSEGCIYHLEQRQSPTFYKACTVFACNPHLPIVSVPADATVFPTATSFEGMEAGYDEEEETMITRWSLLHFDQSRSLNNPFPNNQTDDGISKANSESRGAPYVVGRDPSWIPGLVPETFKRPHAGGPRSRGLGGDVALVLGLMAFAEDPERTHATRMERTFLAPNAHWRNGKWRYDHAPRGYPTIENNPRGFLVSVYLDDLESQESTVEGMDHFEWFQAIVQET